MWKNVFRKSTQKTILGVTTQCVYKWEKRQKPKPRHNKAKKKADGLKKNSQITARERFRACALS